MKEFEVEVEQRGTSGTPSVRFTWNNCQDWGMEEGKKTRKRPKHGEKIKILLPDDW